MKFQKYLIFNIWVCVTDSPWCLHAYTSPKSLLSQKWEIHRTVSDSTAASTNTNIQNIFVLIPP